MGYTSEHYGLENGNPMEEIIRFVMLAQSTRFTVTELCEQFGISRKTCYMDNHPLKNTHALPNGGRAQALGASPSEHQQPRQIPN
ncbi:hypothetical protein [Pedosphaera parvula]|uniref:Uncharacterized protein n=1 Tax=Pedosphaera parvula (strain Ellin514) TaxID=320771 RepID=B9XGW8_PEDPL|nr:hypothetical protein [Pedosphaera parvula]EEF60889.1 hypothetical protein Cflav_PD4058 [Pedosphaera parvula Ellin514]